MGVDLQIASPGRKCAIDEKTIVGKHRGVGTFRFSSPKPQDAVPLQKRIGAHLQTRRYLAFAMGIENASSVARKLQPMIGAGQRIIDHRALPEWRRSEEHTSELQSLMRISYAVFCLKKKNNKQTHKQKL